MLALPVSLIAQEQENDSLNYPVDTAYAPPVAADIDTIVDLATAPYLWDEAVPMDADTADTYTTSPLMIRKVPADLKKQFQDDKDLHYRIKSPKLQEYQKSNEFFEFLSLIILFIVGLIAKFWLIVVIVILGGMGIAIYLYMKRNGYMFSNKGGEVDENNLPLEDADHDVNSYEAQIQHAIAEGRFRLAVRLMYLQTIRVLADKGIISYSKEKTNAAYLRSMYQTPWHKAFATLTVDYEYIWYGEVPVNNDQFRVIQGQFNQFLNELGYTR